MISAVVPMYKLYLYMYVHVVGTYYTDTVDIPNWAAIQLNHVTNHELCNKPRDNVT